MPYAVRMGQLALIVQEPEMVVVKRQIVLPFLPYSKNVWEGWQPMWKAGARKKWKSALAKQFDELQFPTGAHEVVVSARLVFASNRRRDWQNYVHPLWYFVPDALVDFGVIADDTPDKFGVGANGGIVFEVDKRKWIDAKTRQRTILGFAIRT